MAKPFYIKFRGIGRSERFKRLGKDPFVETTTAEAKKIISEASREGLKVEFSTTSPERYAEKIYKLEYREKVKPEIPAEVPAKVPPKPPELVPITKEELAERTKQRVLAQLPPEKRIQAERLLSFEQPLPKEVNVEMIKSKMLGQLSEELKAGTTTPQILEGLETLREQELAKSRKFVVQEFAKDVTGLITGVGQFIGEKARVPSVTVGFTPLGISPITITPDIKGKQIDVPFTKPIAQLSTGEVLNLASYMSGTRASIEGLSILEKIKNQQPTTLMDKLFLGAILTGGLIRLARTPEARALLNQARFTTSDLKTLLKEKKILVEDYKLKAGGGTAKIQTETPEGVRYFDIDIRGLVQDNLKVLKAKLSRQPIPQPESIRLVGEGVSKEIEGTLKAKVNLPLLPLQEEALKLTKLEAERKGIFISQLTPVIEEGGKVRLTKKPVSLISITAELPKVKEAQTYFGTSIATTEGNFFFGKTLSQRISTLQKEGKQLDVYGSLGLTRKLESGLKLSKREQDLARSSQLILTDISETGASVESSILKLKKAGKIPPLISEDVLKATLRDAVATARGGTKPSGISGILAGTKGTQTSIKADIIPAPKKVLSQEELFAISTETTTPKKVPTDIMIDIPVGDPKQIQSIIESGRVQDPLGLRTGTSAVTLAQIENIQSPLRVGWGSRELQKVSERQALKQSQLLRLKTLSPQLVGQPILTRQLERTSQIEREALKEKQAQRQMFRQKQLLKTLETIPEALVTPERVKVPKITVPPPPPPKKKIKDIIGKISQKGWMAQAKKKGKWINLLEKPTTKRKAGLKGASFVDEDISASFRLVQEGKVRGLPRGKTYKPPVAFRDYKIRKGVKVPLKNQFIEKRKFRLSHIGEVKQIQLAKRKKPKKPKFKLI